jgi:hypothetical protein
VQRRAFTLALALTVSLLAACGDKGPSKQEFLAKADPICKRGNELFGVLSNPSNFEGVKDFANKVAETTGKTVAELQKLKFPSGKDGVAAKAMVASLRTAGESPKAVGPEVDKADYPAVEANVQKMAEAYKAADAKARALGSAECAKGETEVTGKFATGAGAIVKQAYINKADALCKTSNAELDAMAEPNDIKELKTRLDKSVVILEKLTADVKALPAPTVDKDKLDEMFKAVDVMIAKAKEAQAAATAGDEDKTFSLLTELDSLTNSGNAKADAYGFKDCGSNT